MDTFVVLVYRACVSLNEAEAGGLRSFHCLVQGKVSALELKLINVSRFFLIVAIEDEKGIGRMCYISKA